MSKNEMTVWKIPTQPNQKAIAKRSAPLLELAKGYTIKSEDHFIASWAVVLRHDEAIKKINEMFDPFVTGLYHLHKMAIKLRDSFLQPLLDSKQALLAKRMLYRGLQEEAKRKQDEAAAKALQKQQARDLERQAKTAERSGDSETAEVLREEKKNLPLPFLNTAPAVPQQQGSVVRERWLFEIVNPAAVERAYCSPDNKLIRPVVESLGPACNISGLRIWKEQKEHSRSVPA